MKICVLCYKDYNNISTILENGCLLVLWLCTILSKTTKDRNKHLKTFCFRSLIQGFRVWANPKPKPVSTPRRPSPKLRKLTNLSPQMVGWVGGRIDKLDKFDGQLLINLFIKKVVSVSFSFFKIIFPFLSLFIFIFPFYSFFILPPFYSPLRP